MLMQEEKMILLQCWLASHPAARHSHRCTVMWQDCTDQAGHTWTVALFSPVVGRLTFWVAFQGPLPSWTAIASVPTSPATGAFRYASKLSVTLPLELCSWRTTAAARSTQP